MDQPLWSPSPEQIANANLTRFRLMVNQRHRISLVGYPELYQWSIDDREGFWSSLWEFGEVVHSEPYKQVGHDLDKMPGARWFPGARLNFAENLLRYRDDQPAIIFWGEDGSRQQYSYAQLYDLAARAARGLKAAGVGVGDRVVGFMPNLPQTVAAMLAATSLGAIWSSCSPDFGIRGVFDRFGQIKPKVLFTADGYFYNGKQLDCLERVSGVLEKIPSIELTVVVPYAESDPDAGRLPGKALVWDQFLGADDSPEMSFEQLPFDHPLYIMYSSGTTGLPKCMVHGAGGTLLQHLKEHLLHCDAKRQDRIFYFTTCGWMMWNWLVSALATGATLLLFDGSPFYPDPGVLWRMAEKEGMTLFGTSARYIASIENAGLRPGSDHDLSALRIIASTGSPLAPESFDYVYREVKQDVCLSSISGGTDIISCFALGNPTAPVYRSELQCRGLGMATQAFNDQGQPVIGQKGELVCTKAFPSMPIYFWNDEDGQKYHQAYFDVYPNIWHHGDFMEVTEHGGVIMYGRSDATLNPGGVRIGTAEIYRQVENMPEIDDSLVIGQDWDNDVRVLLFVKLAEGHDLTDELVQTIRTNIRMNASPRHVPAKIIAVEDIPYTISGKKVELAVKNIIHGLPVTNRDALKNPESLDLYRDMEELKS